MEKRVDYKMTRKNASVTICWVFIPLLLVLYVSFAVFILVWIADITGIHYFGSGFHHYYAALEKTLTHLNPYLPYDIGGSFVNHPAVLSLVRLFYFRGHTFRSLLLWTSVGITAYIGTLLLIDHILGGKDGREYADGDRRYSLFVISVLFLLYGPFLSTAYVGQINLYPLFFLMLTYYLSEKGHDYPAGISLAFAVILKTSPLIIVIYFLLRRKYKVVAGALLAIIVLSVLSSLQFSGNLLSDFVSIFLSMSNEIHPSSFNESYISSIYKIISPTTKFNLDLLLPFINRAMLFVILGFLGFRTYFGDTTSPTSRLWLFNAFITTMVVFSPLVWYHHSVFLLLPIATLLLDRNILHRGLGVVVLLLIQSEKVFEHYLVPFPWPILLAHIILVITSLYMTYKTTRWSNLAPTPVVKFRDHR